MRFQKGCYVLAVDGARAVVLVNDGGAAQPRLRIVRERAQTNPKSSLQGRDKPGRAFESAGTRRSAHEGPDHHQRAEDRFVADMLAALDADAASGAFESLVVVAPPEALGAARAAISPRLGERVIAWIDKDLAKSPAEEIARAVSEALDG